MKAGADDLRDVGGYARHSQPHLLEVVVQAVRESDLRAARDGLSREWERERKLLHADVGDAHLQVLQRRHERTEVRHLRDVRARQLNVVALAFHQEVDAPRRDLHFGELRLDVTRGECNLAVGAVHVGFTRRRGDGSEASDAHAIHTSCARDKLSLGYLCHADTTLGRRHL